MVCFRYIIVNTVHKGDNKEMIIIIMIMIIIIIIIIIIIFPFVPCILILSKFYLFTN